MRRSVLALARLHPQARIQEPVTDGHDCTSRDPPVARPQSFFIVPSRVGLAAPEQHSPLLVWVVLLEVMREALRIRELPPEPVRLETP